MILIIALMAVSLLPLNIRAQNFSPAGSAKNEALGAPVSVPADEWSLWRNPAGLTAVEQAVASTSVRKSSSVDAFARSIMFATSTQIGSLAAGVNSFGDELYNEGMASLAFANKLGLASLGIRTDFYQLRIDGDGTKRSFGLTIGCIARISERISLGISARNVNLPSWSRAQPLPVVLNSGIAFTPGDNFLVVAELEKNTDFDATIKGGFEYSLRKKVFFRSGFNLFPNTAFGGIGLRMWHLGIDYALKIGYLPGFAQNLSVTLQFRK